MQQCVKFTNISVLPICIEVPKFHFKLFYLGLFNCYAALEIDILLSLNK